jgi:hypothetical protein
MFFSFLLVLQVQKTTKEEKLNRHAASGWSTAASARYNVASDCECEDCCAISSTAKPTNRTTKPTASSNTNSKHQYNR